MSRPDATIAAEARGILERLGVARDRFEAGTLAVRSPITGEPIGRVVEVAAVAVPEAIARAHAAFLHWRLVPAPRRGALVRLLGEELRAEKQALGRLVTLEVGKVVSEGLGEV